MTIESTINEQIVPMTSNAIKIPFQFLCSPSSAISSFKTIQVDF